jgi:hypothetical protein
MPTVPALPKSAPLPKPTAIAVFGKQMVVAWTAPQRPGGQIVWAKVESIGHGVDNISVGDVVLFRDNSTTVIDLGESVFYILNADNVIAKQTA